MDWVQLSIDDFAQQLASKAPVPGGGGTSALAGGLGVALGSMVANLTLGKKAYAAVQEEIGTLLAQADALRARFLGLIARDAQVFEPLSQAYGLPKATPEQQEARTRIMEGCLAEAAGVPLEIMEVALQGIRLHDRMADIGSAIAISDVGVGVALCRAALQGGALNVTINTKLMKNRDVAADMNSRVQLYMDEGLPLADKVFAKVADRLKS